MSILLYCDLFLIPHFLKWKANLFNSQRTSQRNISERFYWFLIATHLEFESRLWNNIIPTTPFSDSFLIWLEIVEHSVKLSETQACFICFFTISNICNNQICNKKHDIGFKIIFRLNQFLLKKIVDVFWTRNIFKQNRNHLIIFSFSLFFALI